MAKLFCGCKEAKWQVTNMFRSNRSKSFIVRPVCNARTLDEIIVLLKDAVHFAVFDSTKGFSHVPLD